MPTNKYIFLKVLVYSAVQLISIFHSYYVNQIAREMLYMRHGFIMRFGIWGGAIPEIIAALIFATLIIALLVLHQKISPKISLLITSVAIAIIVLMPINNLLFFSMLGREIFVIFFINVYIVVCNLVGVKRG